MSLEHLVQDAQPRDGVYCLLMLEGMILLASLPGEDLGKAEGDLKLDNALFPLLSTMFSVISGGVKPQEPRVNAMLRELKIEAGLALNQSELSELAFPTTHTIQDRRQRLTYIQGCGFRHELSETGLSVIELHLARQNRQLALVSPAELLNQPNRYPLRPFMRSVVQNLVAST